MHITDAAEEMTTADHTPTPFGQCFLGTLSFSYFPLRKAFSSFPFPSDPASFSANCALSSHEQPLFVEDFVAADLRQKNKIPGHNTSSHTYAPAGEAMKSWGAEHATASHL